MIKSIIRLMAVVAIVVGLSSCKKDDSSAYTEDDSPMYTDYSGGCEAVDLGLSVKWASYNVGANTPEDFGDYFAWGETYEKENYSWDNEGDYKWGVFEESFPDYGMTKYNSSDMNKILDAEDDPATENWGTKWRTPTLEEVKELLDNTKCEWSEWDSVRKGFTVKGIKTGNTIFLPAAGYCYKSMHGCETGTYGYYWSSSINEKYFDSAYDFFFIPDGSAWRFGSRERGESVRAVTEY